ncbi:MAG: cutinase family protein [Actinomycetes bacterium]
MTFGGTGAGRQRPLRVDRPSVLLAACVLLLAAAACTPSPRAATVVADASECRDVLLVAARGSSAPIRSKEVVSMWSSFTAALPGRSVELVELGDLNGDGQLDRGGYTAVEALQAPAVDLAANPEDTDVVFIGGYNQSRRIGTLELVQLLRSRGRTCPMQRLVLAGYSMGAHATGVALRRLPTSVTSRIDAVEFFGDPSFMLGPWARVPKGSITAGHGFLGPRPQYVPAAFAARTESWCGEWDGLCTGNVVLSVSQLLPCDVSSLANLPVCQSRHVDYEKWAIPAGMQAAAARVSAASAASPGR